MKANSLSTVGFLIFISFPFATQDLIIDVNLTTLEVVAEDETGDPVLNLTADDLEILEDGEVRPVKHLSLETKPLAVGLVVDRSSSIAPVKDEIDAAVFHMLKAAEPDDQVFLMTFAADGKLRERLTAEHRNIAEALRKAKLGYGTRLYDVLVHSLQYLATSTRERRVLIVFSDGADHYSKHTLQQVLDIADFHAVPIYMLSYPGDDSRTWSAKERREVHAQLEQVAGVTTGQVFYPEGVRDCAVIGRRIFRSVRHYYRIGFYSSERFSGPTNLQVRLRQGGSVQVRILDSPGHGRQPL